MREAAPTASPGPRRRRRACRVPAADGMAPLPRMPPRRLRTPPRATKSRAPTPKPAGGVALGDGGNQITKIEARGKVVITSDQDQTTTSDWALYDVPAQLVTVGGNVVLTQGKNVLKGDRLVIDLKTGESRFENTGNRSTGGKIRALFMPKQDAAAKNGKAGDGETSKDARPTKPRRKMRPIKA